MWFLVKILRLREVVDSRRRMNHVWSARTCGSERGERTGHDALVDVVSDQRSVDEERYPLSGQQETEREEGVGEHLGEDELSVGQNRDEMYNTGVSMDCETGAEVVETNGIELVTQVDRVDVITLEVGEHDDL